MYSSGGLKLNSGLDLSTRDVLVWWPWIEFWSWPLNSRYTRLVVLNWILVLTSQLAMYSSGGLELNSGLDLSTRYVLVWWPWIEFWSRPLNWRCTRLVALNWILVLTSQLAMYSFGGLELNSGLDLSTRDTLVWWSWIEFWSWPLNSRCTRLVALNWILVLTSQLAMYSSGGLELNSGLDLSTGDVLVWWPWIEFWSWPLNSRYTRLVVLNWILVLTSQLAIHSSGGLEWNSGLDLSTRDTIVWWPWIELWSWILLPSKDHETITRTKHIWHPF